MDSPFIADFMNFISTIKPPFNTPGPLNDKYYSGALKGFDSGVSSFLGGKGPLQGKEGLSQSFQDLTSRNAVTDQLNASVGKFAPQPNSALPRYGSQPQLPFGLGVGQVPAPNEMITGQMGGAGDTTSSDLFEKLHGAGNVAEGVDWSSILSPDIMSKFGLSLVEPVVGKLGGRIAGKAAGAAAATGLAAAEGFANPIADIMALYKILGLTGLF